MSKLTYKQLKNIVNAMTEPELALNVTIHDKEVDEYYAVEAVKWSDEKACDVLDPKHPFLEMFMHSEDPEHKFIMPPQPPAAVIELTKQIVAMTTQQS